MDIRRDFYELLLIVFLLCIQSGLSFLTDEDYFDEPSFNRCPWIRNKLKNGRVRYRYKGRVAKFLCDSGFELAGKRSSTCVRGQWSNPVPVCVARGCPRVPTISNGRITEMYRGALLVYDCNPGYMLDGNPTIHCDGRRWNTSPPSCAIATEKPDTYCDFENPDLCGWSQDPNHDFDWTRNQFSTPSGHVGTGPAFDHTFGENKGGFYLFIEASSPRKINDTARLFSPVYPPDLSGGCFIFWFHMYGATTGGLRVYLKPESHVFDELTPMWQKYGDLGNQWLKGHMIVPVLHENFQIIIEGLRGESYVGDSAIDDVRLTTNLCDSDDNSTDTTETVDQYSCRGRCQESGSESSCGCNVNCIDEPNFCCRDYYTICTTGNSTSTPNTDEPPPEDYTTTSSTISQTVHYTTVEHSEEISTTLTKFQTEKSETTNATLVITSSTSSPKPVSQKVDEERGNSTLNDLPTKKKTTVLIFSVPSTISTEEPTISNNVINTTQYTSSVTPLSTTTTSTTLPISTTITTTSLKTTVTSTPPPTTSTILPTSITSTQDLTTSETKQTSLDTKITTISTISPVSESTTQTVTIPIYANNSTISSTSSSSSISTNFITTSPFAATSSSTEPITLSTTTESSTRKTYNLRPRNRTISTMIYTAPPTTIKSTLQTYTTLKESTSSYYLKTSTQFLTTWHRYPVSSTNRQSLSSLSISTSRSFTPETTKSYAASETSLANTKLTTRIFNRFSKATKSSLPKTSDFYESKSETISSNSSMPIVVSIIVVILICLIAGAAYFFRKRKSKRQSKLSDDSEMRFLQENDYMDYSDASALDRILEK